LTIKIRSNLTADSYIERTIKRSIITEQLWKNRMKWEDFDDQVGKICMKIGYIHFYSSRHPYSKLIKKNMLKSIENFKKRHVLCDSNGHFIGILQYLSLLKTSNQGKINIKAHLYYHSSFQGI
jgi:hypothetical protein